MIYVCPYCEQVLDTTKGWHECKALDIYLMTDQPPTCPKDGVRVDIILGVETNKQVVQCPKCGYVYRLEEN